MTKTLIIDGMSCSHCVAAVKNELEGIPGVDDAEVSLNPGKAEVSFSGDSVTDQALKDAVEEAGYSLTDIIG